MAERNWGLIKSGATFETLATTIIFFEDQKAALFGRRGQDGGQDARSGDGIECSRPSITTARPPKLSPMRRGKPARLRHIGPSAQNDTTSGSG